MPTLIESLNGKIEARHLLKHPFYVAWSKGELTLADLRHYAQQYFAQVSAFPTYLSEMHSRCKDLDTRQIIAGNLADEEGSRPTHPDLWLDFAAGIGVLPESVLNSEAGPKMTALIEQFRRAAKMDTGLAAAALYSYERQIPEVAEAKIEGLEKNYGIADESTLRYFAVHRTADEEHAAQWEEVLARHAPDVNDASLVSDSVLMALWDALTEIHETAPSTVSGKQAFR